MLLEVVNVTSTVFAVLVICLYCCSCHLRFYDRGRLGRVEIATLRVGAKEKEGMGEGGKKYTCTISSFLLGNSYTLAKGAPD